MSGRLPDFVVIGTMKSGTTSLYTWLRRHPGARLPSMKEPHFFSRDEVWERGTSWYCSLFDDIPADVVTGELSVSYTSPEHATLAADRLLDTVPDARLVCVLRNPADRIRSHYVHELRRGRERRPFLEAISDPSSPYVATSEYAQCLEPWVRRSAPEQLLVLTLDQLGTQDDAGWDQVQHHLGLVAAPRTLPVQNKGREKSQFTPMMLWMHDRRLTRHLMRAPRPLRQAGRALLLRRNPDYLDTVEDAWAQPLPDRVQSRLAQDRQALLTLLHRDDLPW